MNVYITFDVEVWCNSWRDLDARFPASFERYYFGRSDAGDYALPKTLEILNRHGLLGVFFVEPLFSARFGSDHLDIVTGLIRCAGQDIQLHLHPEWTDEITPPIIEEVAVKRQHLTYYTEDEQTALIGFGRRLLEKSKGGPVTAFRAGSFAANSGTFRALRRNDLLIDSSLNEGYDYSEGSIDGLQVFSTRRMVEGVTCFPVTVFRDGFGRERPAQLNGASFAELRAALMDAQRSGLRDFVIVSHNFEMLKPGTSNPDWIVVRRFEALCRFLSDRQDLFQVRAFPATCVQDSEPARADTRPMAGPWATAGRHWEQLVRRFR